MHGSTRRRSLIKAAMFAPVAPVWGQSSLVQQWFGMDDAALRLLAVKVTDAVAPSVWAPAVSRLANQMANWQASLALWHQDDLVKGRIVDVHGIVFSQTQLGLLASIALQHGDAA